MRAPRHIRLAKAKVVADAKSSYLSDRANGLLDKTGKTAKGLNVGGRPVNIGFRSSPNLLMGYTFHQPMNAKGVTTKRRKDNLTDSELYSCKDIHHMTPIYETVKDKHGQAVRDRFGNIEKRLVKVRIDTEAYDTKPQDQSRIARIRVGTTPSHMVPIKDKLTGEEKLVRVKAKAKWQDVGTPGIIPKDGGKE